MSAVFVAGDAADYLSANAPVTAYPLSVSCWFKSDDVTGGYTAVSLADSATNADWWRLEARGDVGGDPVRWDVRGTGTGSSADTAVTTAGYSASTWTHALGVSSSDSSHTAYINGGNKNTITTQVNPLSINLLAIGVLGRASPVNWFGGKIAEVAIWNTALGDADAVSLAAGTPASSVQAGSLVFYATLLSSAVDSIGGITITNNSSVSFDSGDHPTITAGSSIPPRILSRLQPGRVLGAALRSNW